MKALRNATVGDRVKLEGTVVQITPGNQHPDTVTVELDLPVASRDAPFASRDVILNVVSLETWPLGTAPKAEEGEG